MPLVLALTVGHGTVPLPAQWLFRRYRPAVRLDPGLA
jgi:hypothetical protein